MSKIAIRERGKIVFVEHDHILVVEGQGNHVVLRTPDRTYLLRASVSTVEERLKPFSFVRIHRSTVVNEAFAEEIRTATSGETFLRVKGINKEYGVSRKYRNALKSLAACWI